VELAEILEGQELEDQALVLCGQVDSASHGLLSRLRLAHPEWHGNLVVVESKG
jgi:hypothetical protein